MAAVAVRRALLASAGGLSGYAVFKAHYDPPQLVWDLDSTILCSVTPISKATSSGHTDGKQGCCYPSDPSRYFDQIDDDFPYDEDIPNTRTFWRPGARMALQLCGLFSELHIFTTAQGSYTANILAQLDPDRTIFRNIIHRGNAPASVKKGKDLSLITCRLDRAVIFDDRIKNFVPQSGQNGIHVKAYDNVVQADDLTEMKEMMRLVGIAFFSLLAPDTRDVVHHFRSEQHKEHFPDDAEDCS